MTGGRRCTTRGFYVNAIVDVRTGRSHPVQCRRADSERELRCVSRTDEAPFSTPEQARHKRCRYAVRMIDAISDDELDAILAQLEQAGLVEQYVNDHGEAAMRLTKRGEQVANQAAMSTEDDAAALMAALLPSDS